ncbi:hypothetical protein G7Z17_g6825 [Cylindrodendrum hubeiense]|uniref:Uncharacterized protein n=1 Tax=Cylindrodendrum hubeiense TaxID=595255 RepID=A0A9P5H402_9HYPO|nr:hypothetical protein G7Z17_g6825 [Cylindrodendrum hubeiense]
MAAVNNGTASTPPRLTDIISSYAILPTLASWLSTLDLYHLALTNRANFSYILASPNIFKSLSRHCLCDGRGLAKRQEFRPPYNLESYNYIWGSGRKIHNDEPIEVRLYNLKCDEAGALPCVKCGINLCEECRYYPRERPERAERRPHLNAAFQLTYIMCLCEPCDAAVEKEVSGKFLNDLCDCDVFKRWICTPCKEEEGTFIREYFKNHTLDEGHSDWDNRFFERLPSKGMIDHQFQCVIRIQGLALAELGFGFDK